MDSNLPEKAHKGHRMSRVVYRVDCRTGNSLTPIRELRIGKQGRVQTKKAGIAGTSGVAQ
jgi:hypothetical protein